jgi:hypothetical protein
MRCDMSDNSESAVDIRGDKSTRTKTFQKKEMTTHLAILPKLVAATSLLVLQKENIKCAQKCRPMRVAPP